MTAISGSLREFDRCGFLLTELNVDSDQSNLSLPSPLLAIAERTSDLAERSFLGPNPLDFLSTLREYSMEGVEQVIAVPGIGFFSNGYPQFPSILDLDLMDDQSTPEQPSITGAFHFLSSSIGEQPKTDSLIELTNDDLSLLESLKRETALQNLTKPDQK